MRNEARPPYPREPFPPSPQIVAANMLFLARLTRTLVVASISMLVKEWLRAFGRGLAAIVNHAAVRASASIASRVSSDGNFLK